MIRLQPRAPSRQLDVRALRRILEATFDRCEVDEAAGETEKLAMIARLKRMGIASDVDIQRLSAVRAAIVLVGDNEDDDSHVSFLFVPGEDVTIGFSSARNEELGSRVAGQVAAAINYDIRAE
jgi:hypothetical protein